MAKTHLILLGGFLGAGKTTLLLQVAKILQQHGIRVGMITNDQDLELVDTITAESAGIETREVSQGCFGCRFNSLLDAVRELAAPAKKKRGAQEQQQQQPTVIFAEPVGNSTDLVATVLRPMCKLHPDQFNLAPLSITVDATRLLQFIRDGSLQTLTDDITYLFAKQIEEADLLLLNKCDLISESDQELIEDWLKAYLPTLPVIPISALEDGSVNAWLNRVIADPGHYQVATRELNFDYTRYAQAKARIAWLNTGGILSALEEGAQAQGWAYSFLRALIERLDREAIPIAHIKLYVANAGDPATIRASIVGPGPTSIIWDQRAPLLEAHQATWLLNARADTTPEKLRACVGETLVKLRYGAVAQINTFDCFKPAALRPTHRITLLANLP
jgi:G3E family GTPase